MIIKIVSLLLTPFSCGGGSDEGMLEPEDVNTEPTTPDLVNPSNNKVCIDNNVVFEWSKYTDN